MLNDFSEFYIVLFFKKATNFFKKIEVIVFTRKLLLFRQVFIDFF